MSVHETKVWARELKGAVGLCKLIAVTTGVSVLIHKRGELIIFIAFANKPRLYAALKQKELCLQAQL